MEEQARRWVVDCRSGKRSRKKAFKKEASQSCSIRTIATLDHNKIIPQNTGFSRVFVFYTTF